MIEETIFDRAINIGTHISHIRTYLVDILIGSYLKIINHSVNFLLKWKSC